MPTIKLNKKDLLNLIGKKLSDKELKDRISMLGTDLEEVNDNKVTVEVFPNRPDMLSSEGFARALSSFIGVKKGLKEYKVKKCSFLWLVFLTRLVSSKLMLLGGSHPPGRPF